MGQRIDRAPNADPRLRRIIDRLRQELVRNQTRVLEYSVSQPGNIAATTTVLYQTKIPANTLSRNGDSIQWHGAFTLNGAGAGTRLRFYLGPQGVFSGLTILYDTGVQPVASANSAVFSSVIVRYGINTSAFSLQVNSTFAGLQGVSSYGTNGQSTQSDLYLSVLGDGASANDASGFLWHVIYLPTSTPNG